MNTDRTTTFRMPSGPESSSFGIQGDAQKAHNPGLETILFTRGTTRDARAPNVTDTTADAAPDSRARFKITEVRVCELGTHLVAVLLMIPFCAGGVLLAEALPSCAPIALWQSVALVVALVALSMVHEVFHAVGLLKFAHVPWKYVQVGMRWGTLTPYCQCLVPVPLHAYRRMAQLPLLVIGPVLLIVLLAFPAEWLGIVAGISVASCAGDVWLAARLARFQGAILVQDCSSDQGCDVLNATV